MSRRVGAIADDTLSFIREAAADSHPNEYMGLLRGTPASKFDVDVEVDGYIVTDVLVIPATKTSPVSATLQTSLVPNDGRTVGSVHSHPNGVLQPSDADLATFSRGTVHLIIGAPYGPGDWEAFDREGNPRDVPVLHVDLPDAEDFFDFSQADIDAELNR
ncbi:MAG: Mov34/MPN/PAD-1 family protein [Halobacteriaceae archaeon]